MQKQKEDILRLKEKEFNLKEKELTVKEKEQSFKEEIQKKKEDVKAINGKSEQISRIRQLLAAAWSEDLKD